MLVFLYGKKLLGSLTIRHRERVHTVLQNKLIDGIVIDFLTTLSLDFSFFWVVLPKILFKLLLILHYIFLCCFHLKTQLLILSHGLKIIRNMLWDSYQNLYFKWQNLTLYVDVSAERNISYLRCFSISRNIEFLFVLENLCTKSENCGVSSHESREKSLRISGKFMQWFSFKKIERQYKTRNSTIEVYSFVRELTILGQWYYNLFLVLFGRRG